MYIDVCTYTHTHIYIDGYFFIYICLSIHTFIHIYTCTFICIYIYIYICILYIFIYAYAFPLNLSSLALSRSRSLAGLGAGTSPARTPTPDGGGGECLTKGSQQGLLQGLSYSLMQWFTTVAHAVRCKYIAGFRDISVQVENVILAGSGSGAPLKRLQRIVSTTIIGFWPMKFATCQRIVALMISTQGT